MKRFKVFKIIYYGFMVVIGVIMCFILPSYNQYTALTKAVKSNIKNENYSEVVGFFSTYYNSTPVIESTKDDSKFKLYEATRYVELDDSSSGYYYAETVYMGFIFNVENYNNSTTYDTNGNELNNKKLIYSDGIDKKEIDLEKENLYYISELDFIYFWINKSEVENSKVDYIKTISITDSTGEEYISGTSDKPLTFISDFFKQADEYVDLFNEMYTKITFYIDGSIGSFTKASEHSVLETGAKITYTPTGPCSLVIDSATPSSFTVTGASLIENQTNKYQLTDGNEITITANQSTTLKAISIFVGDLEIRYSFNDDVTSGDYNWDVYGSDNSKENESVINGLILLNKYNEDDQNKEYEAWKEKYEFTTTNYSNALSNVTLKTVLQIIFYFVIMMIIGDFLVGKRYILYFFGKLFGKKSKAKQKEPEIKNEYEVNFVCIAHVPVGYTKPVTLVYKKDNDPEVTFVLEKEHNYKLAIRTINGTYQFVSFEAEGIHPIKKLNEVIVRGYRYENTVTFVNNDENKQ